ncbi:MAG: UDP-forming cellulose synthase catalytic subunit [Candidatus Competibacter denitrificans]
MRSKINFLSMPFLLFLLGLLVPISQSFGDCLPLPITPPNIAAPTVVGQTQAAATTALLGAGLVVGTITQQVTTANPAGTVLSQTPAAGACVLPGDTVNLTVAVAPVTVPNVVGQSQSAATAAITAAGLTLGAVTTQNNTTVPAGTVLSQNPAAGATANPGAAVALVVATGSTLVNVPNVIGLSQAGAALTIQGTCTSATTPATCLTVGTVTQQASTTVPAGQVINQSPAPNSPVEASTSVNLWVSSGPPVTVPNVVGQLQGTAADTLVRATLTLDTETQKLFAVSLLGLMWLLASTAKRIPPIQFNEISQFLRLLIIFLSIFISARYLLWRTFNSLPTANPISFGFGLMLYIAEVYAFLIMVVGAFVTIHPLYRPIVPLPADRKEWPTVDILIPSYNESDELLEITLLGVLNIDYPKDKLAIYLLDDGSTDAKRNHQDSVISVAAHQRHRRLSGLCQRLGIHYIARKKNEFAKAGNINYALNHIHGDLVLILDADHVPTVDILQNTVGWFKRDPKLFLVQTPHFFVSPDPIEKNLKTYQRMPSEQEMFYTNIQRGLDFWNASFFCGSAAILRRRHLDEVGGLQGLSVTEDAETALALHARGYRSAYIWKPMVAGLQPETFVSFVKQRVRWAQGMTQILLLKNPLCNSGLDWWQRLSYLNSMLYWMFPFARVLFLVAPLGYLLFGLGIYNASLSEVLLYTIPHLVSGIIVTDYLYGNARWAFVSEFYELMLGLFMIKPLINAVRSPHSPTFEVTLKGELLGQDHISPLARPLYLMLCITLFGLVAGIWRLIQFPEQMDTVIINLVWGTANFGLLLGGLGALLERHQKRETTRIPCEYSATLYVGEEAFACRTRNLSIGGIGVLIDSQNADYLIEHRPDRLAIHDPDGSSFTIGVDLQGWRKQGKTAQMGLKLASEEFASKAKIVRLAYGDSDRWRQMLQQRDKRVGVIKSILFLTRLMFAYLPEHLRVLHATLSATQRALSEIKPPLAGAPSEVVSLPYCEIDSRLNRRPANHFGDFLQKKSNRG